jgi:hypothetical protein
VALAAAAAGLDPALVVALSYTESRFSRTAISPRDARGPLQVRPWFHCPGKRALDCDLIKAGIGAIVRYQSRYGRKWLCHWNSGNKCYRRSHVFARLVRSRADALRPRR